MIDYITKIPSELLSKILKYNKILIDLMLTCKIFLNIIKDNQFKMNWLFFHFGKSHALFHTVRLGPNFINVDLANMIVEKIGISRYFIQRLALRFSLYDKKLLELKLQHNNSTINDS
ncbi:20539_t:CDS:1 [Cetraspora pellucida]|uniref:20539_t:CDS:1 n=1 Tax=Cetraspora pellucida TaxID=1433469 RepID=A0A9N9K7E3_9GLOM|nr:20539_t:CDS:1 [Cetraspora pellucida]